MDQFWFMKLPAWMWIKLTKKTLISMDLKCWLWYITYFCSSLLEIDEKPKTQEKIKVTFFFCLQFWHIFREVIAAHFSKFTKFSRKMPNWRQKRQNGRRQLKIWCQYKIIKLLALINALDTCSKSNYDPKWLHLALNVSSKHSVPKKMR